MDEKKQAQQSQSDVRKDRRPEQKTESKPVNPAMLDKDFRHMIRIVNTDLDGAKPVAVAIRKIKGVSYSFSNMLCTLTKIDKNILTGKLNDKQVAQIEEFLLNPTKFGVPAWMLNRRGDIDTGDDVHLLAADIKFVQENDKKRLRRIKTYKGIRLAVGLTVRGQRTKSNFRKNKGKVQGVQKKKTAPSAAPAKKKEEPKKGK